MPSSPDTRQQSLMAFGAALAALERSYRAAANKAVSHIGVSQSMALPLVMIGRQGNGVRPGVLAEVLGVEGASLVRQLDQLVHAGLIDRREDAVDRRAKTIHLTPKGARARAKAEGALTAMRTELFEGVSDADMAATLRVFAALQAKLGRGGRAPRGAPAP